MRIIGVETAPRWSPLLNLLAPHIHACSAEQVAEYFNQCVLRDLRLQRYRSSLGTLNNARAYAKAAKLTNNLATISSSHFILGFANLHNGSLRTAERRLLAGIQTAQRSGHRAIELRCRVYLSLAYRLQGHVEFAVNSAKEAREAAKIEAMSEYVRTRERERGVGSLEGRSIGGRAVEKHNGPSRSSTNAELPIPSSGPHCWSC